ncbi:MAG: beta strand repeat-containing protein, partial [Gaiellaceae bacterium]
AADVRGATLAQLDGDITGASALTVSASSSNTAIATADIFSIGLLGALAGAAATAEVTSSASTQALVTATSSIGAPGAALQVLASSNNDATAVAQGKTGSIGLAVSLMFPEATVDAATRARLDGDVPAGGSLTVRSTTSNTAIADANITAISLLAAAQGTTVEATVTAGAANEAILGSGAVVTLAGTLTVEALQTGDNRALATADSTGTGLLNGGLLTTEAEIAGATTASVLGTVTAGGLTVTADGDNDADASTSTFALAALGFSGSGTLARVLGSASVTATVAPSVTTSGAVSVTATSDNDATAVTDAASGSLAVGLSFNEPRAEVHAATLALLEGDVAGGTTVTVAATSSNTAVATADIFSIGLIAGVASAEAKALVAATATTQALVSSASSISASGAMQVLATSDNDATTAAGGAVGAIGVSVGLLEADADVHGATLASLDAPTSAGSLTVRSRTSNSATADVDVVSISLVVGAIGTTASAIVSGAAANEAVVSAPVTTTTFVTIDAGQTAANRTLATIDGTATGIISAGVLEAEAIIDAAVLAHTTAALSAGGSVTISAAGANDADASTESFQIGALSFGGAGSLARVSSSADVSALVPAAVTITAVGSVTISASSNNDATSSSDAASGAIVGGLTINLPLAEVHGATLAQLDGDIADASGLTVSATSSNTTIATADVFSAGLIGAGAGAAATATLGSGASTQALVGSTTQITAPGGTLQLLAASDNDATASAESKTGAIGLAVALMYPNATVDAATRARLDGDVTAGGSLTVRSTTSNLASADTEIANLAIVATGTGAFASAVITANADNEAIVSAGSTVALTGSLTVQALQSGDNRAFASIESGSAGFFNGGILVAEATIAGATTASVLGTVNAGGLTVTADGDNDADASTSSFALSAFGYSAAGTLAQVTGAADVTATVASTVTITGGSATITATSDNDATASTDAASGGLIGAFGVNVPLAEVLAVTRAQFDGDVVGGGSVTVQATSSNTVSATADIFSIGIIGAGAGAAAIAEVDAGADTEALVGTASSISAGSAVQILAVSDSDATAVAQGRTGALGVAVSEMNAFAKVNGATLARLDGDVPAAGSLTLRSRTSSSAIADVNVAAITLVGGATGAFAYAEIASGATNEAIVAATSTIAVSGALTVQALQNGDNSALATADSASTGIYNGGILIVLALIHGSTRAAVDGSGTAGGLTVTADGDNDADATTTSRGLGFIGYSGAGTQALVSDSAGVTATVGSGLTVNGGAVSVTAASLNTADAATDAASGGVVGSFSVNVPIAEIHAATLAQLDGDVTNGGAVTISASSANTANATADIFSAGLIATGAGAASFATVGEGATTQAIVGSAASIQAPGSPIQVLATSDSDAQAIAEGFTGAIGLSVSLMLADATVAGVTRARFDGDVPGAGSLTVRSSTSNAATAEATITSITLIGSGAGATAEAEITSAADNEAIVGTTATVALTGTLTVDAIQTGENRALATADGTGTGLLQGGVLETEALIHGAVLASVEGTVTAGGLSLTADGDNDADASTESLGIGALSFSGSGTNALIGDTADVTAIAGPNVTVTGGTTSVSASSLNTVTATSDAASGGLGALTVTRPEAKVRGATLAQLDGDVTGGSSVSVSATSANAAVASAEVFSIGIIGNVAGASALAEVAAGATTLAAVGSATTITAPAAAITVSATSVNSADADATSSGGGLVSVAILEPVARVAAPTEAAFDGDVAAGASLTVQARGSNSADANANVVNITLLGGGTGARADADVQSSAGVSATVGSGAQISVSGLVKLDALLTGVENRANAVAQGGSGGIFNGGSMEAEATISGAVLADLDGDVLASGSVLVLAGGGNWATADTFFVGISVVGLSGSGAQAEVTGSADVEALVGSSATIASSGDVQISATGDNDAFARSDGGSGGLVNLSESEPTARVRGATRAVLDGDVSSADGFMLTANASNTATATSEVISVGLLFSGAGTSASADIASDADVEALVSASASIAATAASTISATSNNDATATARGGGGGLVNVADIDADATTSASTSAKIADAVDATFGSLAMFATGSSDAVATASQTGLSAIGGGGADADATDTSVVEAVVGAGANVTALSGALGVAASLTGRADAEVDVLNLALFGTAGDSDARATADGQALAYAGSGAVLTATGNVAFDATGQMIADADATGFSGALGLSGGGAEAVANLRPQVKAYTVGGGSVSGDAIRFRAILNTLGGRGAFATAEMGSLALGAGISGGVATVDARPVVEAKTGPGTALTATGDVLVEAVAGNLAIARSQGTGGGLLAGVGSAEAYATASASVTAYIAGGVPAANSVSVRASSTDTANARAQAVSGGLYSGTQNDTQATTQPVVTAYIGNGVVVVADGNVTVEAESYPEADAQTKGSSTGAVGVSASTSRAVLTPNVFAYIGTNAVIDADGSILISATAAPQTPSGPTGQITNANAGDDTLTVDDHRLLTGDAVEYDNLSQTPIGGLVGVQSIPETDPVDGSVQTVLVRRQYTALNVYATDGSIDPNRIRLGGAFDAAACTPSTTSCITGNRDTITFDGEHNFAPGDAVKYAPGFGNLVTVGGLNLSDRYYVIVVDERTIKLAATPERAANPLVDLQTFFPSGIAANTITIAGHGFGNGDAVTYDAPDPLGFRSATVDAELVEGNAGVCDDPTTPDEAEEDCIVDDPNRHTILFLDDEGNEISHGLADGDLVLYGVTGPPGTTPVAIGNLVSGKIYRTKWVSDSEIKLRPTTTTTVQFESADGQGATDRIDRTDGGSFIADGFRAGAPISGLDQLDVSGTAIHDGAFTIADVSATTITLSSVGAFKATRVNATLQFFQETIDECPGDPVCNVTYNRIRRAGVNWADVTTFAVGDTITVDAVLNNFVTTISAIAGDTLTVAATVAAETVFTIVNESHLTATLDGPVIDLLPDKSEARDGDLHTIIRADKGPIGGLVDGQTYYVVNRTDDTFQLAQTPGGTPITLDTTGLGGSVAHLIGFQGVDLAPASGEQELRIDVTSGVTGYQTLLGPGGVPLNTLAPTGGNGVSTSVSHGSGRGLFFGGARNRSEVSYTSTVRAHAGSSSRLISGGDVTVAADSSLVVDAYTKNSSGGLVSDGNSRSYANVSLTTEAYVDTGSTVFADGNLTVSAATDSTGKAQGDAKGGAIILSGSADADVATNISYTTTARLGSDVDALVRGLATISSDTATTGRAEADAKGGGFALNGQGDSDAV